MKEKFDQFYNTWNEKECEVNDPTNYAQCMDLAYAWVDALGITRDTIRAYYAYQVYTQPKDITLQYFELVPNTPSGLPQVGDIVVFSNEVGVAGHIAIATGKGDLNSFESFDQNWGTTTATKKCRLVVHNYNALLGWLRKREPQVLAITDQTRLPIIDENGNQMEVQAVRSRLADQKSQINDLQAQIVNCQVTCENKVNEAVNTAIAKNDENWQSKLDSANLKIEQLKLETALEMDWRTLLSIAFKKMWASKRG